MQQGVATTFKLPWMLVNFNGQEERLVVRIVSSDGLSGGLKEHVMFLEKTTAWFLFANQIVRI